MKKMIVSAALMVAGLIALLIAGGAPGIGRR